MARYLLHPKHPLRTALYVILAVGLVVGGFVTFKASQTSTEGRSKAAEDWIVVANNDFGFGNENWTGDLTNVQYRKWGKEANEIYQGVISGKLDVRNYEDYNNVDGYLHVAGKNKTKHDSTGISIGGQNFIFGKGSKQMRIRMSLKPAKDNKLDTCCVFEIYQGGKKVASEKFAVNDDGQMKEIRFPVQAIGELNVDKFSLLLKGFKAGDTAEVDYIHFYTKPLKR